MLTCLSCTHFTSQENLFSGTYFNCITSSPVWRNWVLKASSHDVSLLSLSLSLCLADLLRMFFDCLYDEDVISEDAFYKWETSKDPAEQHGKGVALKSVTAFFTWLREAEEESEDNWRGRHPGTRRSRTASLQQNKQTNIQNGCMSRTTCLRLEFFSAVRFWNMPPFWVWIPTAEALNTCIIHRKYFCFKF